MREESSRLISGKSIVNPRFVRRIPNAHNFALWKGATVDTNGTALPYDRFFDKRVAKTPVFDLLRIKSLLVLVAARRMMVPEWLKAKVGFIGGNSIERVNKSCLGFQA